MSALVFACSGNDVLASALSQVDGISEGKLTLRQFPDSETYVRIESNVAQRDAIIACTLDRPDGKVMPLYILAQTLRAEGAKRVWLVAPYLAYMRQDSKFHAGEAESAKHFARLLSSFLDGLITVDPHLHRINDLMAVYSIRAETVSATTAIASWITEHVPSPFLIGPDSESEQWVSRLSHLANCPYAVLEKTRRGDTDVVISLPGLDAHRDRTPVLVDDIISTGRTMIAAMDGLRKAGFRKPVCVGVHAIFAGDAYDQLRAAAGVDRIVTCNTIPHASNAIDVHLLAARHVAELLS